VGLRPESPRREIARCNGFTEENGTLRDVYDVISTSDLLILLIEDSEQVKNYETMLGAMKSGAILGLSHGFLLGHLDSVEKYFPNHISVIAICPKGMGPSVRILYELGSGINCSFAVEQDLDGRATDVAIAWAYAIGAPTIFQTTLRNEYKSDIFGERGVLLGGVYGMVEALYRFFIMERNMKPEAAFELSVENVTGVLSPIISKHGILGVYERAYSKESFKKAFHSAYQPYYVLLREIYDEVASGNEIRSVVMAGKRRKEFGWTTIERTSMWKVGEKVRAERKSKGHINDVTAGIYCGMMMAQIDVLMENGHCFSEICNETVIEAVDSLNPYMHYKGPAYMIDNCSATAREGTRKWGPRFDHVTMQQVLVNFVDNQPVDGIWFENFLNHPIHQALAVCATKRPPIDISLVG
jgi:ketol-acid reductoisomerase